MNLAMQLLFEMYDFFKHSATDDDQSDLLRDVETFLKSRGYLA